MLRRIMIVSSGLRTVTSRSAAAAAAAATTGVIAYQAMTMCESTSSAKPILFFSDLDNTLVGGDAAGLQEWCTYWQEEERAKHDSILCFNTGRCITDYQKELAPQLPVPDVLICGDGLEIRFRGQDGTLVLDEEWERRIRSHWDESGLRSRVLARMQPLDEGLIGGLNDVENSPPRGEARWAITVTGAERARALASQLEQDFEGAVYCYAMRGWDTLRVSYVVCALPAISGKANAARHVQARLNMPDGACVAAGDSENDATMLKTPYTFVAVSNASPGLVEALNAAGTPERHFRAGEACASGVVEGLRHVRAMLSW
jgi:sucrose-phosphate synthase